MYQKKNICKLSTNYSTQTEESIDLIATNMHVTFILLKYTTEILDIEWITDARHLRITRFFLCAAKIEMWHEWNFIKAAK